MVRKHLNILRSNQTHHPALMLALLSQAASLVKRADEAQNELIDASKVNVSCNEHARGC